MQDIKGKTALITGGTKGIGFGIAESMLQSGMKVAITGRKQDSLNSAVEKLSKLGEVIGIVSDVRNLEDEQNAIAVTVEKFGRLDALIANAGVGHFAPITELSPDKWKEVIDINLTGVFNSVKAGIDALIESKGYLITIASLAGANFFATGAAYNASKFGLVGFTQAVMLDVRSQGVKVTTIMPGSVTSHFNNHEPNDKDAWKIQPEDIGELVVDLLEMNPRALPSKIEIRPSIPPKK